MDDSKLSVKSLRAQFEQRAHLSQRKVFTPEQFFREQRESAEKEAQALMLARKKAAAFNMAMRQLELKQAMSEPTPQQEEERAKLRKEARRLSVALRTIDGEAEENRPVLQQQERRATHLLLASMAEELEQEMKKEELEAIREEEEAKERAQAIAKQSEEEQQRKAKQAKDEEEMERLAHEMAEMARKQVEEDNRVKAKQQAEEEERKQQQQQQQKKKQEEQEEIHSRDRLILTTYLRENYPEKLSEVETLLAQFAGNLDVLFEELGKNQKFKEEEEVNDGDDEQDSDEDDGPSSRKHGKGDNRSSIGATTVHSFRDDETVSPAKRKANAAAQQAQASSSPSNNNKPAVNEKSFLKPGVDLRSVITSFYQIYANSKLKDIDDILRHFDQRESDLFRTLEVKYDVTFSTDGTCVPNNGDRIGEPFMDAEQTPASKFAVDVQARQLKDKLAKQGQKPETVHAVLASSSGMM